ncbi:EpsG family protein [Rhodovibrio salinarum]|uniref:EpsG family protein n=1 Tax=Rhodovibrio salinarum TaxID=1087 RepID=UPI0009E0B4EB|nr:EpsG family protein [Rhodovibrio salinarum]
MSFYIALEATLIFFAGATFYSSQRNFWIIFFRLTFAIIVVFKLETGTDWQLYVGIHESLRETGDVGVDRFLEPGYIIIAEMASYIFKNPNVILWTANISMVIALYYAEKFIPRRNVGLFYLIVLNFLLFPVFFGVTRQALALSLCIIAFILWNQNKIKTSLILFLMAPLFQISAILYIGILAVCFVPIRRDQTPLIYLAISVILKMLLIALNYSSYTEYLGRVSIYLARPSAPFDAETFFLITFCILSITYTTVQILNTSSKYTVSLNLLRAPLFFSIFVIAFIDIGVIRNRALYFLVPALVIAMLRNPSNKIDFSKGAVVVVSIMSIIYYIAWLHRDIAYMYIPYKNYVFECLLDFVALL